MTNSPYSTLPSIKEIVDTFHLAQKKSLGQNFLYDLNITDKIVRHAGDITESTVLEIGPGPGGLSRSILKANPKKFIAIDFDYRCIKALDTYLKPLAGDIMQLVEADAIKYPYQELEDTNNIIIANLPYNISTPLLFTFLKNRDKFSQWILMFQKEVAERITSAANSKSYGRLSVMIQLFCETEHVLTLPPEAFVPPPKVHSSVISITPRHQPIGNVDFQKAENVCRTVFNQRRKTLRASLKPLTPNPVDLLESINIDPARRPETLTIEEFSVLINKL